MSESGDPDTFNSCGPHNSSPMMAFPSRKKRKEKKSHGISTTKIRKNILMKRKKKRNYRTRISKLAEDCSVKLFNFY